jgi:hypothetical protein
VVPCRAVDDPDACPLAIGVDVALVVRHHSAPTGGLEPGLTCALRAGVPVVTEGPGRFDPYDRRTTRCTNGDVVDTCRQAVNASHRPLQERLARVTEPIVGDDVELTWTVDLTPDRAHLVGHGPPIDPHLRNRVAVRAIDAVRGSPFARPRIDVSYRSSS